MKTENEKNSGPTGQSDFRREPESDFLGRPASGTGTGAVVGGLPEKAPGRKIDPAAEEAYWQSNYTNRPYVEKSKPYEAYRPAYRAGYEGYVAHDGKRFEEAEEDLQQHYYSNRDKSDLEWDHARHATRDAWERVESQHANPKSGGEAVP